ncbi:MAG: response regulator [Deltaproteobacteria bacterium]|nr:response regulator [Deltaproteobacteria bacterium]
MSRMIKENRILVVDDEETIGLGMSEVLKDAGFNAFYVTSGKDAIEAISKNQYSLVFMDMVMPGMNGLETFRKIKEISPKSSVVLFTGYFKDADKTIFEGVKEGMIDMYIRKPFFSEEIINTAKRYSEGENA